MAYRHSVVALFLACWRKPTSIAPIALSFGATHLPNLVNGPAGVWVLGTGPMPHSRQAPVTDHRHVEIEARPGSR